MDSVLRCQAYVGDVVTEGMVKQSPQEEVLVHGYSHHVQHSSQHNPGTALLGATAVALEPLAARTLLLNRDQRTLLMLHGF